MEITLNETDLLVLAQQAGIIAGVADSLSNGFMPDKRTKALHDASELIMGMMRTKVKSSGPISSELADLHFKK